VKKTFFLLLTLFIISHLHGQSKNCTQWWLYNYGDYSKTRNVPDPRIEWAFQVFQRLKAAADYTGARIPRLFIINPGGAGKPRAIAIPDGGIIIDTCALDLCYNHTREEEGDRRLAFILGHELAHLANRDFLHQEAFLSLKSHGSAKVQEKLGPYFEDSKDEKEKQRNHKKRELLADRQGVIYAAMAGYKISRLFDTTNDFLRRWAGQIGKKYFHYDTAGHPAMQKRVQFIRSHLSTVIKRIELFRAGVLLFQKGSYHDSIAALREFAKYYPAREVLNNIGACNLHLTLKLIKEDFPKVYSRFRLSTAIAYASTAEKLKCRSRGDYLKNKNISRYLEKALHYFRLAAQQDKQDRTCRYNLAAALILKRKYAAAQAVCNAVLEIRPRDVKALNNLAVALYYYGKEMDLDTAPKALQILKKARRLQPRNIEVLYNLAAFKQQGNRKTAVKKLRQPSSLLPGPPHGITPGQEFAGIRETWNKSHLNRYKIGSEWGEENEENEKLMIDLQVMVKDNLRVLAIDGTIEIVEKEVPPTQKIEKLLERFGPPGKRLHHTGGTFYVYEDRGFSIKEIDGKVCSYTWFEKGF
jgi:tetratricopeptide (TPR) repeat protein